MVDSKLQEIVIRAVELLPELWKQAGSYQEAVAAYRHALLSQWSLDNECCARIQNRFAVFLLYGGVEAGATSLAAQIDGSFVPKNNLEEAILLLLILLRKCYHGMIPWDPSVMEHFTFVLSLCGQASILAKQIEEALPGIYARCDRWNNLALCYCAAGQNKSALNLFRKSLNINETTDYILALLTAAKICSEDWFLASEGITYARRAFAIAEARGGHLKGVCFRLLGICLGQQAKVVSSDLERTLLQTEALKSLEAAISLMGYNPDIIFELGMEYTEHHNTNAALWYAKEFIDATGGSELKGWRFLALALSAQQRYSEADVVIDAALDETGKWDQGTLLRMKAKLKIAQSLPVEAVETYSLLLALVQAQRKTFGSAGNSPQMDENKASEFEVWLGLANLYSSLSHWRDAEICLEKARTLKCHSAAVLHTEEATPKTIMRVMGVKGLTLYHLKSHLQKFKLGKQPHKDFNDHSLKDGERDLQRGSSSSGLMGRAMNKNVHVLEAQRMHMEVQRRFHEQLEVQRHLQLRIEAQGKYMQTILEKACQTLGEPSPSTSFKSCGNHQGVLDMALGSPINMPSLQDLRLYGGDQIDMHHQHMERTLEGFLPSTNDKRPNPYGCSSKNPMIWGDELRMQELGASGAACLGSQDGDQLHSGVSGMDNTSDLDSIADVYDTNPILDSDKRFDVSSKLERPSPRITSLQNDRITPMIKGGGFSNSRNFSYG